MTWGSMSGTPSGASDLFFLFLHLRLSSILFPSHPHIGLPSSILVLLVLLPVIPHFAIYFRLPTLTFGYFFQLNEVGKNGHILLSSVVMTFPNTPPSPSLLTFSIPSPVGYTLGWETQVCTSPSFVTVIYVEPDPVALTPAYNPISRN